LRNVLLDYLAVALADRSLAAAQFAGRTNMTDRAAALTALAHRHPDADEPSALWPRSRRNTARSARHGQMVSDTGHDPRCRRRRSRQGADDASGLLAVEPEPRACADRNVLDAEQTGFHRADGAGYTFFAETVLEIEKRNPQLAARLATAMRSWRSLEPTRQAAAREALLTIAARTICRATCATSSSAHWLEGRGETIPPRSQRLIFAPSATILKLLRITPLDSANHL
jgi:aminopeptidase N